MAYGIDIIKIKESNGVHYYYVEELGKDPSKFYIGIDPQKNCIYYYYIDDFSKPNWICDLNNPEERLPRLEGLTGKSTATAMLQAMHAIKKNEFPRNIGRYS